MQDTSDDEAALIYKAFEALENLSLEMGGEQAAELHVIRAKIFGSLQRKIMVDPIVNAIALIVREVFFGIQKKREVGAETDEFRNSGMLSPEAEEAYFFGQKLVRWNWLMEHHADGRPTGGEGPLSAAPPDELCVAAIAAFDRWILR